MLPVSVFLLFLTKQFFVFFYFSLKDALEDEEVKPKLQCLMSNPDFSMVTVQCEDSGIHWETTSSRCSTPWASEASTTSDVYSMESSSAGTLPGKVIFIMDEGKLRRKKVRPSSSGKFSRLSSHHKKSGDNPKPSADSVGESFKQALEKAKRHLSTHTEEVSTTDSSAKCPEEHTVQHSKVPNLDVSTENTTQEEKMNPVKAEATAIPPDNQEEQAKCTNAGRKGQCPNFPSAAHLDQFNRTNGVNTRCPLNIVENCLSKQ